MEELHGPLNAGEFAVPAEVRIGAFKLAIGDVADRYRIGEKAPEVDVVGMLCEDFQIGRGIRFRRRRKPVGGRRDVIDQGRDRRTDELPGNQAAGGVVAFERR
ncbi:hypothetical protein D3C71_1613430 [compost metagenome]